MNDSKAVNVTRRDLTTYNRDIVLFPSKLIKHSLQGDYEIHKDFACQYDKEVICTCKRTRKRYYISQDVFRAQERYPGWKSFTEIGVGSIKTLPKRRTRRIYLQETRDRGIESSELLFEEKKKHHEYSYYEQKKTSSKCVGGILDVNTPAINKKLSPIVQQKSGTTSPIYITGSANRLENIGSNHSFKNTKVTSESRPNPKQDNQTKNTINDNNKLPKQITREIIPKRQTCVEQAKIKPLIHHQVDKDFSSDSLVQHVHNLENPSFDKQSKTSIDLLENKLEREYRKMFATETNNSVTKPSMDRPSSDLKKASLLRRRFESLRKGLCKKEDSTREAVINKASSRKSVQSRKDVSIASDPPSLEAKSYSNTKIYSPYTSFCHPYNNNLPALTLKKSPVRKKVPSTNWSTEIIDSDCQSVRGMFKLWGKKFNFEEENNKKSDTKIPEKVIEFIIPEKHIKEKKESKRFFFFNKRSKNKSKQVYKSKKGVTAGRCEVQDGLAMKIKPKDYSGIIPEVILTSNEFENYDNILRKSWLKKFLTSKVDSRRSVRLRWNNNMYSTSSSTVFELLDCVYKNNRIFIGSKSEISTCDSSNYYAHNNQRVQFMPNHVEAWMIPETIVNPPYKTLDVNTKKSRNIEVTYLDKKWYIDKSHRGNKIELVLQSNNIIRTEKSKSSDYILIDIPKGYFTDSMESNHHPTSDEEVYKITDYESPNSKSSVCKRMANFDTGDHLANCIHNTTGKDYENLKSNTLETVIKKTPLMRDVVIQGSQIYIPKHCDVIGVGIITQRDIRDIKKPILKIHDDMTDSESPHNLPPPKKCEFAESYLQDYYRNWIPLGIDFFSWCVSDSQLRSSENNSRTSLNNQGDGSKSCPNMIDDYQASTVVSSCNTSSCSHCLALEQDKKIKEPKKDNFFSKLFNKNSETGSTAYSEAKRLLPKDSLEVLKRRKVYADGYNTKWNAFCPKPSSAASIENKNAENTLESPKDCKKPKKHVLIPDCEPYDLPKQSCDKCFPGILTYKGSNACKKKEKKQKHTSVIPDPVCGIPSKPLCSNLCAKDCYPPCVKEKEKGHARPCSGKLPPVCPKCSPLQPCEIEKFLQNRPSCPSFPQKCSKCCSPILPQKCPQCSSPILPQKCPKCSSPIIPIKCAKCCLPIVPQKCPICPSPSPPQKCPKCVSSSLAQKCPKCSLSLMPNKCPKCSLPVLPQKCSQCYSPMFPQKCPKCSTSILPQKCQKCSPILPQKSSNSTLPTVPQKCPKCFSFILPQKCPKCSSLLYPAQCPRCCSRPLLPKCPKCSTEVNPQKCPKSCSPILLQKCPKCSTHVLPQKCPRCCSPILAEKCIKCSTPVLPLKCPKCCQPVQPQKCPRCSKTILSQKCPKCSSQNCSKCPSPQKSHKCDSAPSTQKCPSLPKSPVKCISRQSPPRTTCPSPTKSIEITQSNSNYLKSKCSPCTNSFPCKRCNSPQVIPPSGLKLHKAAYKGKKKESESNLSPCLTKCSPPPSSLPSCKCSTTQKESMESFKNIRPLRCPKDSKSNETLIRISSKENIKINLKKPTASTEEIRNGYNIKVQDEDGQTLYERIDYRKVPNNRESTLLQNKICGDSYIHRVSTPSVVLNKIVLNENNYNTQKSATSLENFIEINLTLKFKQTDKTEVNICNQGGIQKEEKETDALLQSKEIFHVQDRARDQKGNDIDDTEKNEVNIKILIKNGISANEENKSKQYVHVSNVIPPATEDFSKNISDKFHTVSTGYSQFGLDQPVYPVDVTTLDLEKSTEGIQKEKSSEQFLVEDRMKSDEFILTASSISLTERTATDHTISSNKNDINMENRTDVSEKFSKDSLKNGKESNTDKSGISMTDEEKFIESYFDQDRIAKEVKKLRGRQQKKEMLKKLFEEASCIDSKNKEKVKGVREMLHAILTSDSSGQEDTSDTNFDLLKGLSSSLKSHFRHSDSLTNFYNLDSTILEENNNADNEIQYPTKENNSLCSTDTESDVENPQRCMCSTLAARLKMNTPGINPCCCRGCDKHDEEINCNLISDVKNLVDGQTQNSKNEIYKQAFVTTNVSTTVKIKSRESRKETQSKSNTISKVTRSSFQASVWNELNQRVLLNLSDEDTVIYLSKKSDEFSYTSSNYDTDQLADILQSDETKKAVLEIYAEKTVTNKGSHFVAKLPKFVLNSD